jgi:hypothetical protein
VATIDVEEIRRRLENAAERMQQDFASGYHDGLSREQLRDLGVTWAANLRREAQTRFSLPIVMD